MLKIIFANFWTWAGATILTATILGGVRDIVTAARKPSAPQRRVKTYDFPDGIRNMEVEGVTEEELQDIVREFCAPAFIIKAEEGEKA